MTRILLVPNYSLTIQRGIEQTHIFFSGKFLVLMKENRNESSGTF
ncbi:MAG: hypothetical protein CM15mP106_5180 [Candidatus Neomarinimicrobiota bacterium]|nr:MAG: hypothetical protein CM15mP106_5180 [Candidatus Neomarinimicrobiota bacterium]